MQAILGSSLECYTYVRGHNIASKLLISLHSEKTIQGDAARPPFEAVGWAACTCPSPTVCSCTVL